MLSRGALVRWVLCLVLPSVGCFSSTNRFEDEGTVCYLSDDEGRLQVEVQFPTCLSSSCDTALEQECSLRLEGTTLRIRSRGAVQSEGGTCTADCKALVASCTTDPLAPGEYTLEHGENSSALTLPAGSGRLPLGARGDHGCTL